MSVARIMMLLQQLRAILWKNWIIRKRHYITFFFELAIPLLLASVMCYVISSREQVGNGNRSDDRSEEGRVPATNYSKELFDTSGPFFSLGFESGPVYVVPDNNATRRLTKEMNRTLVEDVHPTYRIWRETIKFQYFSTEEEMLSTFLQLNGSSISGALVFTELQPNFSSNSPFHYTIRECNQYSGLTTDVMFHPMGDDSQHISYVNAGSNFLKLQFLVNEAYLKLKADDMGKSRLPLTGDLKMRTIPYPSHMERPRLSILMLIPITVISGLIVLFPTMVKRLTDEKANGSREMLRMVGLSDWTFWLANFITHYLFLAGIIVTLLAMFFIKWNGTTAYFQNSNFFAILLFFLVYCMNVVLLAFLVSIPFNRPIFAVVAAVIVWNVSFLPSTLFSAQTKPFAVTQRFWSCLLPNNALTFGLDIIGEKESVSNGVHFDNFSSTTLTHGALTLTVILSMMLWSCFLMCLLIWYLDNVWLWQAGVPKPFWFPFTRSYWINDTLSGVKTPDVTENPKFFEPVGEEKPVAIRLSHVSKVYGITSKKLAVSNLSLNIYRQQLTCLLGHNGAGKTTTMNMITGMFTPSEGSISINGYDMVSQTRKARESISLCPQHNPLYEELTAAEHLFLYGAIKGRSWSTLGQEVLKTITEITLSEHSQKHPSQLSGGMKRKLCLGIALVGGSAIVILDEPTSGLDTEVRRSVWDLLREVRKTRTILLSTHDMEEADALGDRILIMTAGKVTCAGSTMFLKKVYGAGHNLRIAKLPAFDFKETERVIRSYFPDSQITSNVGSEIVFSLEGKDKKTNGAVWPVFFKEFEQRKTQLDIESFGLAITTMEDVFLRVGELSAPEPEEKDDRISTSSHSALFMSNAIPGERLTGFQLTLQRMTGLFYKRMNYVKRDWKMMIFMILIPAVILMICFAITKHLMDSDIRNLPLVMELDSTYGETIGFLGRSLNTSSNLAERYEETASQYKVKLLISDTAIDPNDVFIRESEKVSLETFVKTYLTGLHVSPPQHNQRNYTLWASNAAYHAPPLTMDLLYKSLDYELSGYMSQIQMTNHPMPRESSSYSQLLLIFVIQTVLILLIPIAMAFLSSSYVLFPIHENTSKSKLMQLMTGLHPLLLHFVNFIFDFTVHIIASAIAIGVFLIMDYHHILTQNNATVAAVFMIFVVFGAASIVMAYVAAFFLSKRGSGYAILVFVNLTCGIVFTLVVFIWRSAMGKEPNAFLLFFFSLMPIYDVTSGITKLYKTSVQSGLCNSLDENARNNMCTARIFSREELVACCPDVCGDYEGKDVCLHLDNPMRYSGNGVGHELLMMFVAFLIYVVIVCVLDSGLMRKAWRMAAGLLPALVAPVQEADDSDVAVENKRIRDLLASDEIQTEALVVDRVSKRFGQQLAVKDVTFGVHKQECFGLLGVNGAGKTTTFRMITGDLMPTSGNAFRDRYNLSDSLEEYRRELGYCPQFDPLLDKLTGSESLFLFGRLRGVAEKELRAMVSELVLMSDLQKHADKRTETYSGGNKRKLSLAIALMASPKVILLDEPTAGVDPSARRKIWSTLSNVRNARGCSLILTSHSMQECENLCSRISIMVGGRFQCIGSTQHLRSRFGQGYTVMIKLKRQHLTELAYEENVLSDIQSGIRSAVLTDKHESMWTFRVPDTTVLWSTLFERMEAAKKHFDFEDYTVSDTTLEQIFIGFARSKSSQHHSAKVPVTLPAEAIVVCETSFNN